MSCKNWKHEVYGSFDQSNNAIEKICSFVAKEYGMKKEIYYESCGPSAVAACIEALEEKLPPLLGCTPPTQFEDVITIIMNSGTNRNFSGFTGAPVNRFIKAYAVLVDVIFDDMLVNSPFRLSSWYTQFNVAEAFPTMEDVERLKLTLQEDDVTVLALMKNPGHFISLQHIDSMGIVYYNDSWKENYFNPSPSCKRSLHIKQLASNLKQGYVKVKLERR